MTTTEVQGAQIVAQAGDYGHRVTARVERGRVVARWYEGAVGAKRARQASWPDTRDGRATAEAFVKMMAAELEAEALGLATVEAADVVSVRKLFERYVRDGETHWRPNTLRIYREAWQRWEAFVGPHTVATDVPRERLADFAREMDGRLSLSTLIHTVKCVQRVYRWGQDENVISPTRLVSWKLKVGKDRKRELESPDEYTQEEFEALLGALDPADHGQWRPWVALSLCGWQGARQWAVLHLQWPDIDFAADRITWRLEWDKLGNEWDQPLREASRDAIVTAFWWRRKLGYDGPWLIPAGSSKNKTYGGIYSPQSLWAALQKAEVRAGIEKREQRGAHGLRRLLAGNVEAATGSAVLAMQAIGDTDVRMASRYIKRRQERLAEVFGKLDGRRG